MSGGLDWKVFSVLFLLQMKTKNISFWLPLRVEHIFVQRLSKTSNQHHGSWHHWQTLWYHPYCLGSCSSWPVVFPCLQEPCMPFPSKYWKIPFLPWICPIERETEEKFSLVPKLATWCRIVVYCVYKSVLNFSPAKI